MAKEYFRRGSLMHRMAGDIPGMIPVVPQGGFYLWCRYEYLISSKEVFDRAFESGVNVRSGSEFGDSGESHLRFTYSVSLDEIERGMNIVSEVFRQLG